MARRTRIEIARTDIFNYFKDIGPQVYTRKELSSVLQKNRSFWRLAQRTTIFEFIKFLRDKGELTHFQFKSDAYPEVVNRYVWGKVSNLKLATSIRRNSYITHGTAIFLHGLTDLVPKTVYINYEQSPKPSGGHLSQRGIDLAFSRKQRTSNLSFNMAETRVVVINGKNTNRLEVSPLTDPEGDLVDCTSLERTLIDIVVRPAYAGGIRQVVEAYRDAEAVVSVNRMKAILKKLDYVYPYHQSIGFIMDFAKYPKRKSQMFLESGAEFDFYLTHNMKEPSYSEKWRLFFPREFDTAS
jgi:predicted transcriptional regulator of viral defense system